jgi:hypothetical protein
MSCFMGGGPVTRIIAYSTRYGGYRPVTDPRGYGRLSHGFSENRQMKVVRLAALRTGRLYPQEILLVTISYRMRRPQGRREDGRIMSIENVRNNIGNRTGYLPAWRTVSLVCMESSWASRWILVNLELSWQIFDEPSDIKFRENPSSESRVVPWGQTDGRTDMQKLFAMLRTRVKS